MQSSDADLVHRVLAGDLDAYGILVQRHRGWCSRYALRMLGGHREDAEEVVQDTFVRMYRALARGDDPERFRSWLGQILVNRCRTAGERLTRRYGTFVYDDGAMRRTAAPPEHERTEWREEIHRALALLPTDQREAFLLKHVEELSYDEMSAVLGAGVSALKMRVKRACDRLRELLSEAEKMPADSMEFRARPVAEGMVQPLITQARVGTSYRAA